MAETSAEELRAWLRRIPHARMAYPGTFAQRLKYILWLVITPLHPYARDTFNAIGLFTYKSARPDGRQKFLLGTLAPGETAQSVIAHLVAQGYGNHFVALRDRGEVASLRYTPDFRYQYHIRMFDDGEVRAHFEYTTECHPWLHHKAIGFEERREEFLAVLGNKIIATQKE